MFLLFYLAAALVSGLATAGSIIGTLGTIASRHGTTVAALVQANRLSNPNLIRIGQELQVPAGR